MLGRQSGRPGDDRRRVDRDRSGMRYLIDRVRLGISSAVPMLATGCEPTSSVCRCPMPACKPVGNPPDSRCGFPKLSSRQTRRSLEPPARFPETLNQSRTLPLAVSSDTIPARMRLPPRQRGPDDILQRRKPGPPSCLHRACRHPRPAPPDRPARRCTQPMRHRPPQSPAPPSASPPAPSAPRRCPGSRSRCPPPAGPVPADARPPGRSRAHSRGCRCRRGVG